LPTISAAAQEKKKSTEVELDNLKSTPPADWKSEKPNNRLRSHQFRLPGAKDAKDGEVYIFPNLTRPVKENFARWKEMFEAPEGKNLDDLVKESVFMVGKTKVSVQDVTATWHYKDRPFDPSSKTEVRPNSRVVSVIFSNDNGNYLIRLSGPAATVNAHYQSFIDWLKAFK
jgi:hypothetical protein